MMIGGVVENLGGLVAALLRSVRRNIYDSAFIPRPVSLNVPPIIFMLNSCFELPGIPLVTGAGHGLREMGEVVYL